MKKILSFVTAFFMLSSLSAFAQIFTSSPAPLQESSKNVVITFHADKSGVTGLQGLPSSTPLYAHIGVYTTKSPNTWSYVKTEWTENIEANKYKYVSENTYDLAIGDLRTYFGITDASEHITKVCIIARTATGNVQTKDCFIDVHEDGFQMMFSHDAASTVFTEAQTVNFKVDATQTSALSISVNGTQIASTTGTSLSKAYTFSAKGAYNVEAKAVAGGETLTENINILYISNSPKADYPGGTPKMGPVANADGSVTFCIAAPLKSSAIIVGSWDNYETLDGNVMSYQDYNGSRYFWKTIKGLDPKKEYIYYFNIDGIYNVADPYGKLTLDPYSDKWLAADVFPDRPAYPYSVFDDRMLSVYKGDFYPYSWQCKNFEIPDHDQLVIYEMLFRDFTGTEGEAKGDGTIAKAIEKIPYLVELGFNAVELMPVMEFNGNNSWGYNTNFYFSLDKAYGSPDELKQFIDICHQNGIAVILDIVFNQSDGLHPWYQLYDKAANPFYNETAPHGWSVLNDWKQENPVVQQQWTDALKFWMQEYNVDGYRFDLVKGLGTDYSGANSTDGYNASRIAVMKRFHEVIKSVKPNGIHINEFLGDVGEEKEYGNDGQLSWNNQNGVAVTYAKGTNPNTDVFYAMGGRPWGTVISYMESHDEQRIGYEAANWASVATLKSSLTARTQRLGSLAAMQLFTPGPQMVWQFMEIGDEQNTKKDGNNLTDPKIVNWNYLNDADRKGLHDTYSDLIWLRRNNPELFAETATKEFSFGGSVQRSGKLMAGNKEVILLVNPSQYTRNVAITASKITPDANQLISYSHGMDKPVLKASGTRVQASIPANCYALFASVDVAGVEDVVGDISNTTKVYGGNGEIVIEGEYQSAQVYNIAGQVYGSLNVPAGLYIVNVDGVVSKVIVK